LYIFQILAMKSLVDLEPAIGKASSDKELVDDLVAKYPHLPVEFWLSTKGKTSQYGLNKTCAVLPAMYDLMFNNMYWQSLKTANGTFYLYSAFYDDRPLVKLKPVVRVSPDKDRIGSFETVAIIQHVISQAWTTAKKILYSSLKPIVG
jgi:hypothetical protein